MKFKSILTIIFALLLLSILLATSVISQAASEIKTTVDAAICAILRVFQALAAGVAALMIIMQGIKWMTSEDPAGRKSAKDTITHVFVALIIIVIAVQFVNYLVTGTGIDEFTSCPEVGAVTPVIPVGTPCTSSSQCGSDKYCRVGGTCQNKGVAGASCTGTNAPIDDASGNAACQSIYYCDKAGTGTCTAYPNRKPYAKITETSLTRLECQGFTLHGSGSSDPDGDDITDYHWYQVDCNTGTVISDIGSTGIQSSLEHDFTVDGTYCIGLKVTDEPGLQSDMSPKPYTTIYVSDNTAPSVTIKNSDSDKIVIINEEFNITAEVALESGIEDTSTYSWTTDVADCSATFSPDNTKKTVAVKITSNNNPDTKCDVRVTVTDSCSQTTTKTETMQITTNQPPWAVLTLPSEAPQRTSFTIDGSGSKSGGNCASPGTNEAGDSITRYKWDWDRTSPATPEVKGTVEGVTKTITLDKTGYYKFELTVTDSHGQTCKQSSNLAVCEKLPDTNDAPVADASATLTDTRNTFKAGQPLILNASKSYDPDDWRAFAVSHNPEGAIQCSSTTSQGQTITKYIWRATPPDTEICSTTSETCTYTFENFGTYTLKLTVEDGPLATYGKSGSTTITVTINP